MKPGTARLIARGDDYFGAGVEERPVRRNNRPRVCVQQHRRPQYTGDVMPLLFKLRRETAIQHDGSVLPKQRRERGLIYKRTHYWKTRRNVVPAGLLSSAMSPLCAVMIWRLSDKPMPLPSRLVVKNGINT